LIRGASSVTLRRLLRLGVVTTSYPRSAEDPAGNFVAGLARYLARRGHHVEVIAAGPPGTSQDGDISVTRVPTGSRLFYDEGAPERLERSWRARLRAPVFTAALTARVVAAARGWDAVISHWLVPSGLAAAASGKPHLAIAHSGDVHLLARRGFADLGVAALFAGGPLTVSFAGAHLRERLLAACSPLLRHRLAQQSRVCPMGVDLEHFRHLRPAVPDPVRGRPLVVFVGRLVGIKGVDVLVDAVARLNQPAQLVVAGAGPEREQLERRAREVAAEHPGLSIRFAGEVRGTGRDAIFAAADVLVVPSLDLPSGRTEGTPTVALEALAAGVPLVASDVGGLREAVGSAAVLVPPGNPDALAVGLRRVFADPQASAARVRQGREIARRFDWNTIGAALEDAILSIPS
jgi:teichuronic acid biosynthesis glycosyltransferase TuaC